MPDPEQLIVGVYSPSISHEQVIHMLIRLGRHAFDRSRDTSVYDVQKRCSGTILQLTMKTIQIGREVLEIEGCSVAPHAGPLRRKYPAIDELGRAPTQMLFEVV